MKNRNDSWSLFRLSDRAQFDDVSLETIEFFFRALNTQAHAEWLMWREGFTGWRPLGELSQILKHLQNGTTNKPPSPPPVFQEAFDAVSDELTPTGDLTEKTHSSHSSVSQRALAAMSSRRLSTPVVQPTRPKESVLTMDEATVSLMLESQASVEDRNNVRYNKRFKVRIFGPKGIVTLHTTDCSTSGFRLEEPLPAGLPRYFHVEIELGPEGKIPLICSEVREKDGREPTRARIQVNDHADLLKSALMRAA